MIGYFIILFNSHHQKSIPTHIACYTAMVCCPTKVNITWKRKAIKISFFLGFPFFCVLDTDATPKSNWHEFKTFAIGVAEWFSLFLLFQEMANLFLFFIRFPVYFLCNLVYWLLGFHAYWIFTKSIEIILCESFSCHIKWTLNLSFMNRSIFFIYNHFFCVWVCIAVFVFLKELWCVCA